MSHNDWLFVIGIFLGGVVLPWPAFLIYDRIDDWRVNRWVRKHYPERKP